VISEPSVGDDTSVVAAWMTAFTPSPLQESQMHSELHSLSRAVLLNWFWDRWPRTPKADDLATE
jgi:hypothetical protein